MGNNIFEMTDIEIAESFVSYFNIESVMHEYNEWRDDRDNLRKKATRLQASLKAGDLERSLRSKKTKQRDKLLKRIVEEDPRLIQATRFEGWVLSIGCEEKSLKKCLETAFRKMESAMKDADAVKDVGIPPFRVMRSGSGKKGYYKVLDLQDYVILRFNDEGRKSGRSAKNQKRSFERMLITVKEHYGELPQELKAVAESVSMTIDFRTRLSVVLNDMVEDVLRKIEHQRGAIDMSAKITELEHDVEAVAQQGNA